MICMYLCMYVYVCMIYISTMYHVYVLYMHMYINTYECIYTCICGPQVLFGGRTYTHRSSHGMIAPKRAFDDDSYEQLEKSTADTARH